MQPTSSHVQSPQGITEIPNRWPTEGLSEIQNCRDDGSIGSAESDVVGVVCEREDEDDVGQNGEPAVGAEEEIFGSLEQSVIECYISQA